MPTKVATLCFIEDGDRVLLAMKKRGHGEGRWNGYGGKVEAGETIEEALVRELLEESGLRALEFDKRGFIFFENEYEEGLDLGVHIYAITKFEGEPIETEEMDPKWFLKADIPFTEMWPSDRKWFPIYLKGNKFKGNVKAGDNRTEEFVIVDNLEE
jgi:mutator protein MutT